MLKTKKAILSILLALMVVCSFFAIFSVTNKNVAKAAEATTEQTQAKAVGLTYQVIAPSDAPSQMWFIIKLAYSVDGASPNFLPDPAMVTTYVSKNGGEFEAKQFEFYTDGAAARFRIKYATLTGNADIAGGAEVTDQYVIWVKKDTVLTNGYVADADYYYSITYNKYQEGAVMNVTATGTETETGVEFTLTTPFDIGADTAAKIAVRKAGGDPVEKDVTIVRVDATTAKITMPFASFDTEYNKNSTYTFLLASGTKVGKFIFANDVKFALSAEGGVVAVENKETPITLTYLAGGPNDDADWYLLKFAQATNPDDPTQTIHIGGDWYITCLVSINGADPVEKEFKFEYYGTTDNYGSNGNNCIRLKVTYAALTGDETITGGADILDAYTLTIKAGTKLGADGQYVLANTIRKTITSFAINDPKRVENTLTPDTATFNDAEEAKQYEITVNSSLKVSAENEVKVLVSKDGAEATEIVAKLIPNADNANKSVLAIPYAVLTGDETVTTAAGVTGSYVVSLAQYTAFGEFSEFKLAKEIAYTISGETVTFKVPQFVVAFMVGDDTTTETVEENGTVTKPADPVKEGYTFDGWYFGEEKFDFATPITADILLEAKFIENEGTGSNSGEGTTPNTSTSAPADDKKEEGGCFSSITSTVAMVSVALTLAGGVVATKRRSNKN